MKYLFLPYTFLFIILILKLQSAAQPVDKTVFTFENTKIRKEFFASKEHPDAIHVQISEGDNFLILNENRIPYFNFCINHQVVSSADKIWQFLGVDERRMGNGGTEYALRFDVTTGELTGLQITIYQQFFPKSTLVREKVIFSVNEGQLFTLNKQEGKNLFTFPCYSVKSYSNDEFVNTEIRLASWENKPITFGNKSLGNHMYYPNIIRRKLEDKTLITKGPVNIMYNGSISWLTTYEHASQDNINGLFDKKNIGNGNLIVDSMQGTKGVFSFTMADKDFWFLGIENIVGEGNINISVKALRGAYLDGEIIDKNHPYESVWTSTSFYEGNDTEKGKEIIRRYLQYQICENQVSRRPVFYYNTWGLQRNDRNKPLRGILTYDRIFEEIDYAAQLGVDIFVLDDGWEEKQGVWIAHSKRLHMGLAPIKQKLDEYGLKMGLWLSPMGIDSTAKRYKMHPEWVIKDSKGNPIKAQWGHPAFDFVSSFFDLFIEDCKKLVDQGCRFMKWDAINTFYSSLPDLHHGDSTDTAEERRKRYEYLLPVYVTKAMEILTDYEPELIIEIDLTEARRVMAGFAPLSQGKLFWMNNGASTYNDYSVFRSQSMRTIANEFAGIIPWNLITYANYPHNTSGDMLYNVHNSMLAGHGFWGNLDLMTNAERKQVGSWVQDIKYILPDLVDVNPKVVGKVGDSPEIYTVLNKQKGTGQIIGFSEKPINYKYKTEVISENILCILNHPYAIASDSLEVQFMFNKPQTSVAALVLSNKQTGVSIQSTSVPLIYAEITDKRLIYQVHGKGEQTIIVKADSAIPKVSSNSGIDAKITKSSDNQFYRILVKNSIESKTVNIDLL